jgi:hypothetical protein
MIMSGDTRKCAIPSAIEGVFQQSLGKEMNMHMLKLALMTALTLGFTALPAMAGEHVASDKGLGEKLVRQVWTHMQNLDVASLEKTMAKGFQSVHEYGASDREQEIAVIKDVKVGKYSLSDIKATRDGPVIVVTYLVSVEETIKGKRMQMKPAPRLSVFLKTRKGWKWLAHANLHGLN